MWTYRATLIRAVDGDTVDLKVDLGFYLYANIRFRLEGVDTPERGQPGFREATQFVEDWFATNGGECIVVTSKTGKYGRWIATIINPHADDETLNNLLINTGHGVAYL